MSLREDQQQRKCNTCKRATDPSEWVTVDTNRPIRLKNNPHIISHVNIGT